MKLHIPLAAQRGYIGLPRPGLLFAAIAALAGLLYFPGLGNIRAPIWDETYYLTSTARYHEGRTQLASHPPLGLLLIAAGDMASGRNRAADWQQIAANPTITAEQIPAGFDYAGPRLASAAFGVIAAGLFAVAMLELTGSILAAATLAVLLLGDTAVLVQVRAGLLDSFQIAFALGAMLAAMRAIRAGKGGDTGHSTALFAFGACVAAATLVRANGAVLAVIAPFLIWPALRERKPIAAAHAIAAATIGALVVLGATLAASLLLSPLPPDSSTPAGRADLAMLSPPHLAALKTGHWDARATLATLDDITARMRSDLAATPKSDPNGSHPSAWLLARGTILYRADSSNGGAAPIGLVPNAAAWLVSLFGVISSLLPTRLRNDRLRTALLAAWAANMAALGYLDTQRVLYLYHYFIPLILGYFLAAMEWKHGGLRWRPALFAATAVLADAAIGWPFALGQPAPWQHWN